MSHPSPSPAPSRRPVDLLVVGAGPVGIACGIEAIRAGLGCRVVEKGAVCDALVRWPADLVFFSTPELLEIGGLPFVTSGTKPTRREALRYYRKAAGAFGLDMRLYEQVLSVRRGGAGFAVTTTKGVHEAVRVVLATGFFDRPNLLSVPGEELPKVTHYYDEPYRYSGTEVLVVGGGNSAVEAALDLYRNGARVTMAVREQALKRTVKYWLTPDISNRIAEGSIRAFFDAEVSWIAEKTVGIACGGAPLVLPNDFVVALTGYHPDLDFLRACGVEVTPDGHPLFDEGSMETAVPGLYLAGVVAAGVDIGKLFIENGRRHAALVARHAAARLGSRSPDAAIPAISRFQDGD